MKVEKYDIPVRVVLSVCVEVVVVVSVAVSVAETVIVSAGWPTTRVVVVVTVACLVEVLRGR